MGGMVAYLLWAGAVRGAFDESKISEGTGKIVDRIAAVNVVMGEAVGYGGTRPAQYDNFVALRAAATAEELTQLTRHPNATVRCYAFWALSYHWGIELLPILLDHVDDTEEVSTFFGCFKGDRMAGDFFIDVVTRMRVDPRLSPLNSIERATLDRALINRPNDLRAKGEALVRAQPDESLYPRIRELVIEEENQAALVALAKYHKEQDIALILKNRATPQGGVADNRYTYQAISEYPHPDFFPFLERALHAALGRTRFNLEWKDLYQAIASYKNDKAVALLRVALTQARHERTRKHHLDFVQEAVQVCGDPIYDGLLWALWADENRITSEVFTYLSEKDPERAFTLSQRSLRNLSTLSQGRQTGRVYTVTIFDLLLGRDDPPKEIRTAMLDMVLERDRALGIELIRENLANANVHSFGIFTDKATAIKDRSFVEPLLGRLRTESNPHFYLKAAKALLSYGDAELDRRVCAARDTNENLSKGWGGRGFDELLIKYKEAEQIPEERGDGTEASAEGAGAVQVDR
jgi:hypothetical protein